MSSDSTFVAIAGNPNSGKTTAFNRYTGARQHVGNYPGITVEKKEGTTILDGKKILLVDLPGTYSLTAYSLEEVVARRVLAEERPSAVINVVNAGVLERNLYLTVQLLEMGVPVVLALNMMDEAHAQGIRINCARLEELMGVKAIPTVARTGDGLETVLREAVALGDERAASYWKPVSISYGSDIDDVLLKMEPVIEDAGFMTDKYPARWVALKYLEKDEDIMEQGHNVAPEVAQRLEAFADECTKHLQATLRTYPEAVIADYRYGYISSILRQGVITGAEERQNRIAYSDSIDKVLTSRFFGPLILMGVLYAMYFITFTLGEYPAEWLSAGFGWLSETLGSRMNDGLLKSLLLSGIIDGVGGVVGFVPLILIMFLLIAFLEDSGYMARVAYMMDKLFQLFGLHGASVMPFIISGGIAGGCAVPGIMAARTLRSPKERLATILTAPFMACGAKLPVFLLFVGIFFEKNKALVMFSLTLCGWVAALLVARLLRSTIIRGESTPFVMELPPYRIPTLSGMLIHTWERVWQYLKKAGTIILAISIVLWAGMTFPSLPQADSEKFAAERAPIVTELETMPSRVLGKQLAELDERIQSAASASGATAESAAALHAEKERLVKQLAELPVNVLQTAISQATEELESLQQDDPAYLLIEQRVAALEASRVQALQRSDVASVTRIEAQLAEVKQKAESSVYGQLQAKVAELQKELDALPEKQLEAQLTSIDQVERSEALRHSVAGRVGIALENISQPAGFDWRTNIALFAGFAAKEVIVSTLGTAYSLGDIDPEEGSSLAARIQNDPRWTSANAVALLLFTLLYSPCFVAVAVIRSETGSWKWALFSVVCNLVVAYVVAVAAYQIGVLLV